MTKIEAVKNLQSILLAKQFILTGSTALSLMGLVSPSEAKDIDLILFEPTEQTLEILKNLSKDSPANTQPLPEKYQSVGCRGSKLIAIFEYAGFKIDVFTESQNMPDALTFSSICISPAKYIFDQKRKANRPKDWIQLMKIANCICDLTQFQQNILSL